MKSKVITLCGSTRFQDDFERIQRDLTLEGNVVLSCGVFGQGRDADVFKDASDVEAAAIKRILDEVHIKKIDMSDSIYVINPNGYIGESTWREIVYAAMTLKGIYSIEEIPEAEVFGRMNAASYEAEHFAKWQLDAIHHDPYCLTNCAVSFKHRGQVIYDPWIRVDKQSAPWAWEMHQDSEFAVNPFEEYGRKQVARFIFDATIALKEYDEFKDTAN